MASLSRECCHLFQRNHALPTLIQPRPLILLFHIFVSSFPACLTELNRPLALRGCLWGSSCGDCWEWWGSRAQDRSQGLQSHPGPWGTKEPAGATPPCAAGKCSPRAAHPKCQLVGLAAEMARAWPGQGSGYAHTHRLSST